MKQDSRKFVDLLNRYSTKLSGKPGNLPDRRRTYCSYSTSALALHAAESRMSQSLLSEGVRVSTSSYSEHDRFNAAAVDARPDWRMHADLRSRPTSALQILPLSLFLSFLPTPQRKTTEFLTRALAVDALQSCRGRDRLTRLRSAWSHFPL